jgi:hypothetical protein
MNLLPSVAAAQLQPLLRSKSLQVRISSRQKEAQISHSQTMRSWIREFRI